MTTGTGECPAVRHGDRKAYDQAGCRCPDAVTDHNREASLARIERELGRPRRVDAVGTQRRLRALMALGWRAADLAPMIGWRCGELDTIFRRRYVLRGTADTVRRLYVELADTAGPSETTRRRSAVCGYLLPLWWDADTIDDPDFDPRRLQGHTRVDWVVVERLVAGIPVRASREERFAAYERMRELRVPAARVQSRLRMSGSELAAFARRVEQEKYVGGVLDAAVVDVAS